MTPTKPSIYIGTSGWSYASWRGPFFPKPVMIKHQLNYYATQFITTELNGVFYRTPQLAPGYVGAADGLLSQYIRDVKASAP